MKDHVETEWQFASVVPPARWLRQVALPHGFTLGVPRTEDIADVYYDTDDWRIHRAGYALRLRRVGGEVEATLKQIAAGRDGRHERRELTELVEGAGTPGRGAATGNALDHLEGPLAERIHAVAGRRQVHPIVALRTRRRRQAIEREGRVVGELALDVTSVPVDGTTVPARFHRIEVEVAPAVEPPRLEPLVEALQRSGALSMPTRSKLEEALHLRGVNPRPVPDLGSHAIDDTMLAGDVALASLRRSFAELLEHEPGARLGDDPEALHRMRVATRRLRATLRLFAPALPARAAGLHAPLGWLAGVLGEVRDVDVQLERIAEWRKEMDGRDAHALDAVAGVLRRRRIVGRQRMLRALDSDRYERLVTRFAALLRGHASRRGPAHERIIAVAPALIRRRMRKVRKAGDLLVASSPASEYHTLRIHCKKLRYALEAHADVYRKESRRLLESVVRLQKLLGDHQDAEVASLDLRALCDRRGIGLSRDAIFVIGKIAARYEREGQRLRRRFAKRYGAATGRRWKRLRRAMGKRIAFDVKAAQPRPAGVRRRSLTAVPTPVRRPRRGARAATASRESKRKLPVVAG
ncbi:MAG TPA: CHAD domain-containing protein [Candidatus Binatia bacterium]|jgi:CHAD domain-containing protein